jgi:hypothetical protein
VQGMTRYTSWISVRWRTTKLSSQCSSPPKTLTISGHPRAFNKLRVVHLMFLTVFSPELLRVTIVCLISLLCSYDEPKLNRFRLIFMRIKRHNTWNSIGIVSNPMRILISLTAPRGVMAQSSNTPAN